MTRSVTMGEGAASSRHLPDTSDGSFSFQIPTSMRGDYLLADDGESFFQGAGDILATPAVPRFNFDQPLSLSQLTPKPSGRMPLKSPSSPEPSAGPSELTEDNPPLRRSPRKKKQQQPEPEKPKATGITRAMRGAVKPPASPPAQPIVTLKGPIDSLAESLDSGHGTLPLNEHNSTALPTRRGKDAPGIQQERQQKSSRLARPRRSKRPVADVIEDTQSPMSEPVRRTEKGTPFEDGPSGRIVEAHTPHSRPKPTESHAAVPLSMVVDSQPSSSAATALTISQLSPQKPDTPSAPHQQSEDGPLTGSASKRPAEVDEDLRVHKKAKTNPPSKFTMSVSRRLAGSRSRPAATVGRSGAARPRTSVVLAATRSAKRRSLGTSNSRKAEPSSQSSRNPAAPRLSLKARLQIKSGSGTSNSRPLAEQGPSGSTSSRRSVRYRATVPHEFRFHVDSRLEARKCQSEKVDERADSSKPKPTHPIPDFKALHAAHEAELALRKENIQPIVPVPPRFETDARMKERHKFEEQIREKELQRHLELEQKRKERQQQEEEEIRELRKKAIPKAHEVPEWYRRSKKVKSGKGV
ncbi:hypothetical protein BKA70DRAFT_1269394 [Coprinopsis sp. MPI-PUGE-AT-0042]|nr:hypothetical protein BKA70DRAFT_1269394 [Coprinopsis sp. MPI-PUGE-AT-0042]